MTRIANHFLLTVLLIGFAATSLTYAQNGGEKKPSTAVKDSADDAKKDKAEQAEGSDKQDTKDSEAKSEDGDKKDAKKETEQQHDAKKKGDKKTSATKKSDKKTSTAKKDDKKKSKKKPRKTYTVEPKRMKIDTTVDVTFTAREMTEVVLRPESWSSFEILEVAEHGAEVKQGDVLFEFDSEKLNQSITDLELAQRLSELSLIRAEEELPRLEKSLDMRLSAAKRSHNYAHEDLKAYKDEGRDQQLLSLDLSLKSFRMTVEGAKEELEQLEKMYSEDDLTEETEEIVLKRQRQLVEYYDTYSKIINYNIGRSKDIFLPRSDITRAESLQREQMLLEQVRLAHRLDLNAARYRLEQQRQTRAKSLEKHAKLIADRGLMTVKSPAAGVVYYGRNVSGKWSDLSSMLKKFKPKSSVSKNQVLMTIVDPSELYLFGTISEKQLPNLAKGQSALTTPSGEGADPLKSKVSMVSDFPVASGKYAIELDLKTKDLPKWLDPGMSGKAKITTYDNKEALVVPKKAVHTDEFDDMVKYVWVVTKTKKKDKKANSKKPEAGDKDKDDQPATKDKAKAKDNKASEKEAADSEKVEKRFVKVGKTKGDKLEIVDGVAAGDVLSLEDEDKKKDAK